MDEQELPGDTEAALKLWVVMNRAFRSVAEHTRRHIESSGLHPTEFAVLEVLLHRGPLTIGEVGSRVLLTSGSMTHVIDKLERRRMLERRPDPEDRRASYLHLTAEGRALISSIFPAHAEAIRRATSGLTTEEKRIASVLLRRLGLHAHEQG
jgi:MarR family transcriptional regulator, 2-MHQ and catechol-resistance regulon repressor